MKKIMSIFLSISIIASLCCLSVFAHNVQGKYKEYTVIGDSIAAGYGLEKDADGDVVISHWHRVNDSYYDIVTDAIGCDLNIHARDGFTTLTEMVLLDPTYRDTLSAEDEYVVSSVFANHGEMNDTELTAKQKVAAQEIKDSDLVTVNLGSNDILLSAVYRMTYMSENPGTVLTIVNKFNEMLSQFGDLGTTMSQLIGYGEIPPLLVAAEISSFMSFIENYNTMMNKIHELSPDATILALGLYNPIKGTKIGGLEFDNPLISDTLVKMANMYIKDLCPARQYYTYVDVSDTEAYLLKLDTTDDGTISDPTYQADGAMWHPTRNGHAQMAEKILTALDGLDNNSDEEVTAADPCSSYTDIDKTAWYHDAVDYAISKGIMTGTSSTTFSPNSNLTRAQLVQMLYAEAGKPSVSTSAGFNDVTSGRYYVNAVNWANSIGIVSGYKDNTFRPNNVITREEMVVILKAYAKYKGLSVDETAELNYKDASSVSKWAESAMSWAVASKLISGYEDNTIRPAGKTTRAEAAQIMKAFYAL